MNNRETVRVSKNAVVIIAAMSSFLTPFTSSSVNIALPSIGKELALPAVDLNWVATAYLLAAAMFLVPFGRASDIFGRKKVFQFGIAIDAIASILCATSQSGTALIIFRAFQGLGGAMIFGTGIAILTSVFPAQERGKALGFNVAAVYAGLSVGPLIGGLLTEYLGWRSIFFLNAALGFVIFISVLWQLKGEWAEARGEKLDYIGSAIYSAVLVAIMYGFSVLPEILGIWLIAVGVIGLVIFIGWELRSKNPVLNIGLFRNNAVFAFSNLAALINYAAISAVSFLLSLYLQYIKGFSPEHAGFILIAQPVVQVIISPIAGSLSDRIEPRIVASLGMAMTTVGLVLLATLNSSSGLTFILISLVVLGLGFGFFSSPNVNAVMGSAERKYFGVASGILSTMRLVGQTFSLGLVLLLFALIIGRVEITPESYPLFLNSMRISFIVSSALCFAGIFASAIRGKTHSS